MKIIAIMLTRIIAVRFIAVLLGISIFVLSLDVISYSTEILALKPGDSWIVAQYLVARAPGVIATFLPISMLLAMLLALTELSYRNEITALWSAGLSPFRVVVLLLPIAVVVGGINFFLNDRAIPLAAPQLRAWGVGDYGKEKLKIGERDPIWMRSGTDIIRAASASADSTQLKDVILFRRDADGILLEQVFAESATLVKGRWELDNAIVYYRDNQEPSKLATLIYSGPMKPASAGGRSGDPEEMSLADLSYFIENSGFGIRPVWVYTTWWHKRISLILSALLMISLCVPMMTRFRRGGGLGMLFVAGVGLGFLYFVVDGISLTMGELGFVTPWLAAWTPTAGFGALAAMMAFRAERV
jgi:lipopolysaccharide export system permease protein